MPPRPEFVGYEIVVEEVAARPIAAVHASVPVGLVGSAWRSALDTVWAYLRAHEGLWTDGHNIFVYHHPMRPGAPMEVDFGVEVSRAFAGEGDIVCTGTPAGRVVSTVHVGPPDQLARATAAIEGWCRDHDLPLAGIAWEIYGDPGDDPSNFEVKVSYLLG